MQHVTQYPCAVINAAAVFVLVIDIDAPGPADQIIQCRLAVHAEEDMQCSYVGEAEGIIGQVGIVEILQRTRGT